MKLIDIGANCYAHVMGDRIYLYINNEFVEILYVENIEILENPIPSILHEIELSSQPSLYNCLELI